MSAEGVPLADRLRPRSLPEFAGQLHLVGEGKPLRVALDGGAIHSMILWGPPGSGKTTLARLAARETEADFIGLSAVLAGVKDIRAAVEATGRDCFVLAGLETDVCVAQSALGLRAAGYRVAVVADACASPPPNHEHGLRRLEVTGVIRTSVKTVFYEWVHDLETTHRVRAQLNVPYPSGLMF